MRPFLYFPYVACDCGYWIHRRSAAQTWREEEQLRKEGEIGCRIGTSAVSGQGVRRVKPPVTAWPGVLPWPGSAVRLRLGPRPLDGPSKSGPCCSLRDESSTHPVASVILV